MNERMICQRCGTQIGKGMKFCPKCGMETHQNGQQFQNQMPNQGSYFSTPNVNTKKKDSILSVVAFIISLIGCGYFSVIGGVLGVLDIIIGNKKKDRSKRYSVAAISLSVALFFLVFYIFNGNNAEISENFSAKNELGVTEVMDEELENTQFISKSKFQSAVESIGMDYSQVKNVHGLDDWSSGKRYSFVYDGFGYIVYELENGEIESINTEVKRAKIYERGYKPLNYKDFEPDINVINSLQADVFKRLSEHIKGETSIKSKIGSMTYSRIYDYYSISGEVKAKNAVKKKNFTFTADYKVKDGGYKCVYLALDGAVAFGSDQTPELPKLELEQEENLENGKSIILSYDKKGKYGQYDSFNGERYLRYYIPIGEYKVKCNIGGGFYIETIKLHKEDGWDTATTIQQINMTNGEEAEISIEDGQCISLIINTEIELLKK